MMNGVKGDKHYFADIKYGGSAAGHTWAEPKEDESSASYLDANFVKAFKIDDISSVFHYELIAENGGLNSYMTGERKGEIICSDGMLREGEITSLPLAFSISLGSEDQYLDVDFAKSVPDLDCEFCDELSCDELGVGNLRCDIPSPGASNGEVGVSGSSVLAPQCFNDQFETTTLEMHSDSRGECRYERSVEGKMGSNSSLTCDIQDFRESNDVQNTLGSSFGHDGMKTALSLPSFEAPYTSICAHDEFGSVSPRTEVQVFFHDGKETDFSLPSVEAPCTSICAHDEIGPLSPCTEVQVFSVDNLSTDSCSETKKVRARQRRLCRPPQRYLDGSQWLKSRLQRAKNHPTSLLKDKDLGVKSQKKHSRKALEIKGPRTRTNNMKFGSDEEYEPLMSCFNTRKYKKRIDRRKVSQPWTLDEVVSLVDGMSKFGIGQWTAVKRHYFMSSRRTATDIRDKWRNLVKTNCRSSKRGKKDDQHLRIGSQPLPAPVIERVRELADAPDLMHRGKRGREHSSS